MALSLAVWLNHAGSYSRVFAAKCSACVAPVWSRRQSGTDGGAAGERLSFGDGGVCPVGSGPANGAGSPYGRPSSNSLPQPSGRAALPRGEPRPEADRFAGASRQGLWAGGRAAYYRGDYAAAEGFSRKALAIARQIGDERETARVLSRLAAVVRARGDPAQGRELAQESLDIARRVSYLPAIAHALHSLGAFALRDGDHGEALAWIRQAVDAARAAGNISLVCASLDNLGMVALEEGDLPARDACTARASSKATRSGIG
jgi:hypothetical protein